MSFKAIKQVFLIKNRKDFGFLGSRNITDVAFSAWFGKYIYKENKVFNGESESTGIGIPTNDPHLSPSPCHNHQFIIHLQFEKFLLVVVEEYFALPAHDRSIGFWGDCWLRFCKAFCNSKGVGLIDHRFSLSLYLRLQVYRLCLVYDRLSLNDSLSLNSLSSLLA